MAHGEPNAGGRPDAGGFLARRPAAAFEADWLNGDVPALRRDYEENCRVEDPGVRHWEALDAGPVSVRMLVQTPARLLRNDVVVVHFHGGGWIVGSPDTHADITRAICEASGLRLLSVAYRLAPEFVAPAPVEDGSAVLRHLGEAGRRIILCGDSAGGAIALAVAAAAGNGRRILGVASLYGAFGLLDSDSLAAKGRREEGMDRACIERYWRLAHAPGAEQSPYSIAALARPSRVPAYLLAAADDPVRDDTMALAAAFRSAGRPHVLDEVADAGHGFLHRIGRSTAAAAAGAVERLARWMIGLAGR